MAASTVARRVWWFCLFCLILALRVSTGKDGDVDHSSHRKCDPEKYRFLIYDVNPGEGFNLRRDVYIRMANLVKFLNEKEPWVLVLPPWGGLYHWRSPLDQYRVPWKTFFDLDSLSRLAPVMEFQEFVEVMGKPEIEESYYLQHYKEGWRDGKWEERMDERECNEDTGFYQDADKRWRWWFWGYEETYSKDFKCISIQMEFKSFVDFLIKKTKARSIFVHRCESLIHGEYSEWSHVYWTGRRSIRFAKHLRDLGDEFRKKELDSTDEKDKTVLVEDWRKMKRLHGDAKGGPYLAVHLRRRDFLYAHKDDVPSLKETARQMEVALKKNNLKTVFIASDAPQSELEEIKSYLKGYKVVWYKPTKRVLEKYKDGGVAIIDQWICAHARYFMGTSVSTFTFRIHEEREILGFDPEMTFNRFCGDTQKDCEQPTKWEIQYPPETKHTEL